MISASIVLFNNPKDLISKAIFSLLNNNSKIHLFLIDNSPVNELEFLAENSRITYIHNPDNPGFGAAHNLAFNLAIGKEYLYHFIVNPDIHFDGDVIDSMVTYMQLNPDVGMMMPKILNVDGTIQFLPKLLPGPLWIFKRKLKVPSIFHKRFVDQYELRSVDEDMMYNAPIISGCFSLVRLDAIKTVGGYDNTFFMYFEDFDLSRRIHSKYKTLYFPAVSVTHEYERGANKSPRLFRIFISSAISYFNKWGWLYDHERQKINKKALEQF
jgi:GT2 family glycosyltransferase